MTLPLTADPVPLTIDEDGVARVGGTRVTLDTVVGTFKQGATPEEILCRYPALRLGDIYAAIAYYLRHREHVEAYIRERDKIREAVHKEIDARSDMHDLRERLLARRAERSVGP